MPLHGRFHRERFKKKRAAAKPKASKPKAAAGGAAGPAEEMTIAAFLVVVKERLRGAGEMPTYVKLLTSLKNGARKDEIAELLAGHPDLVPKIPTPKAQAVKPQEKPRGTMGPRATAPAAAPAAPDAPVAAREKQVHQQPPSISKTDAGPARPRVDVESVVLTPLRSLAPMAGLVRLAIRRGRPTQRLRLLQYLQSPGRASGAASGELREVFLLQRSSADFGQVVEAMRARLHEDGDSFVQRLAHICAVTDYFTTFELDEQETHDPADTQQADILQARAWNEGRLQLAMEAGVQPLFVDDPGVPLQQSGYAKRAKALGYHIHFESMH